MKKWLLLLFPFLSLFSGMNEDGDFQVWNTDSTHFPLGPRVNFLGELQFRYGDHGKKLYYKHVEGVIHWSARSWIALGPGYRQAYIRQNDKWVKAYDPIFEAVFIFFQNPFWVINNRNRFQYRIESKALGGKSNLIYRNRLNIMTTYRTGRYILNPYVSDEVFFETRRGFYENRARFGVFIPYRQRVFLDLNYIYRSIKNQERIWLKQNVLGIQLQFLF